MDVDDRDVAPRLLAHLRRACEAPDLEFARAPERVLGGNATFVHGFSLRAPPPGFEGELILRIFRADQQADAVRAEAVIQSEVARLGYLAPRVLDVRTEPDVFGAPFIVMERVPGTTLLAGLAPTRSDAMRVDPLRLALALPRTIVRLPRVVAEWLARLHALDAGSVVDALERRGVASAWFRVERELARAHAALVGAPAGVRAAFLPALKWASEHLPDDERERAVCHGDFHVLNLMARGGEVTGVVDWTDSLVAPPAFDVAQSRFLFALGPLSLPSGLRPAARLAQRGLASAFLKAYGRHRTVDPAAVAYYEALRALRELAGVARERQIAADGGQGARRPSGNPWDRAGLVPALADVVEAASGIRVPLERIAERV